MSYVTTPDGTRIFYREFGAGPPIVFSHGWPLNADAWDGQMLFLAQNGYRVIAHDRRGHGRSDQPAAGNDMDTYADDLAALIEALDLKDAILVGHSTGGGEIARYVGRHGSSRVAKMVLVSAVPPIMINTPIYPNGLDISVLDGVRKATADNRSQFFLDFPTVFFGFKREGAKASEGLRYAFWQQGMTGGIQGQYECIRQFSETDFTADLKSIDVPTLVIQGDDDQVVPFAHAGALTAKIVSNATLKVYAGAPHGLTATHQDKLNTDLLDFARS